MTITVESICEETEYKPRPGLRYEIGRSIKTEEPVVVTMRRPFAAVCDEFDRLCEYDPADPKSNAEAIVAEDSRRVSLLQCVTDFDHEISDLEMIRKVIDRVITDFFTVAGPTLNPLTTSLLRAVAAQAARNSQGSGSNGRSPAPDAGPESPES